MYSKVIKFSTLVITTIIYGFLVYTFFLKNSIQDLNFYLKWISDSEKISDIGQVLILIGPIFSLLFTLIIRSIDWRHKKKKDGDTWVLGLILIIPYFVLVYLLIRYTAINQKILYGILLSVNYFNCLLAIFVPQGQLESKDVTVTDVTKYRNFGKCDSYGDSACPSGGCL